jgi:hypothetical protein
VKGLTDWTVEEVEKLRTEQVPEDTYLEYKGALATSKGKLHDDWITGQSRVGDTARFDLMKEIIAFANTAGGLLILGVEENRDKSRPNTIKQMSPLPHCVKLAETLRLGCRDLAEPKLNDIRFKGLPTGADGSGLVLIQVGQSRNRPHRLTVNKECYIRRNESSVAMTMDEIRDLTLYAVTQEQRLESQFSLRSANLDSAMNRYLSFQEVVAMRCIMVPLHSIIVPLVTRNPLLRHNTRDFPIKIVWTGGAPQSFRANLIHADGSWHAILRGIQSEEKDQNSIGVRQLFENGSVSFGLATRFAADGQHRFHLGWILGLVANAIYAIQLIQKVASIAEVTYGVELQVITKGRKYALVDFTDGFSGSSGELPVGEISFPRYQLDGPEQASELLTQIDRDLWNYAERDPNRTIEIQGSLFRPGSS